MSQLRISQCIMFAALVVVGVMGCSDHHPQHPEPSTSVLQSEYSGLVGEEIVVSVAPGWTFQQVATANGWTLLESNAASGLGIYDDNGTTKQEVGKSSGVIIMERNDRVFDPPPPDFPWGDENWYWGGNPDPLSGQASLSMFNLTQVHLTTTGEAVRVAVIDTGLDTTHPVVQGRYFLGPYTKPQVTDVFGHGTAVAGLVYNMAPDALVFPVNVFGTSNSASVYDVANGLQAALDYDADVVCLAIYSDSNSEHVEEKIQDLVDAGVFVVACAGNTGASGGAVMFPARFGPVLSVGATDANDVLTSFSASGAEVEFAAVGEGVDTLWLPDNGQPQGVTVSGTSVSAGLMAGYCALAVKHLASSTYSEILQGIIDEAVPVTNVLHGRINTDIFIPGVPGGGR